MKTAKEMIMNKFTEPSQDLIIEGAGCASCVGKIEQALNHTAGVESAEMNFALRTVTVTGAVEPKVLIKAIEAIGYNAKSVSDSSDDELLDEKEAADQKYYSSLMKQMWIALGLGVPLMVYGLFGGPMTVETTTERGVWLFIGILCAAIMYFSGKHFYIGAWKSLVNHTANMDTLIALGTGTAWIYSMIVVFFPLALPEMARHVYFEATAMIIGLINLGLALEVKARGKTSEAIKLLEFCVTIKTLISLSSKY
jgi:Cu+-exporting ATPase